MPAFLTGTGAGLLQLALQLHTRRRQVRRRHLPFVIPETRQVTDAGRVARSGCTADASDPPGSGARGRQH